MMAGDHTQRYSWPALVMANNRSFMSSRLCAYVYAGVWLYLCIRVYVCLCVCVVCVGVGVRVGVFRTSINTEAQNPKLIDSR